MALDHSKIYKDKSIKNLPHRLRLSVIKKLIQKYKKTDLTYCDIGCSNGYITNIIVNYLSPLTATGMDHNQSNIATASEKYKNINFRLIDLNNINTPIRHYELVTCFECLEHVGNLENGLLNLLNYTQVGGENYYHRPKRGWYNWNL